VSRRDPTLIPGLLLCLALGFVRLRPVGDPDTWWHLAVGRRVLETGARRFPDVTGIPVQPEFTAGEWAFDVLAWGLFQAAGVPALALLGAAAAPLSFLLCWALARAAVGAGWRAGAAVDGAADAVPRWTALAVAAMAAGATTVRFFPRPHVIFLCLLPLLMGLATAALRSPAGTRRTAALLGCVATVALWSQVHPSVVIAPFVAAGIWLPGALGSGGNGPARLFRLPPVPLLATAGLLAVLPLLSPYGSGILGHVTGHAAGSDATSHIGEMAPMPWSWWWPPNGYSIAWVEALAAACVLASLLRRRLPLGPAALALLGLLMTLNSHRFRGVFAVLLIPWAMDVLPSRWGWSETRRHAALALAVALCVVATASKGFSGPRLGADPEWAPQAVAEALLALDVRGTIFNEYDLGGFIGFSRYGKLRVAIDSRTPPYFSDEHFHAARKALSAPDAFGRLDRAYGFDAALVPGDSALCRALRDGAEGLGGWAPVWADGKRALFLRAAERGQSGPGLRAVSACHDLSTLARCAADPATQRPPILQEIRELLRISPSNGWAARLGALVALRCGDADPDRALHEFLPAARAAAPEHPDLAWIEGEALAAAGRIDAALAVLDSAPAEHAGALGLRIGLLRGAGRAAETREAALRLVAGLGDSTPPAVHADLSWACDALGDFDCASRQAIRAVTGGVPEGRDQLRRLLSKGAVPPQVLDLARRLVDQPASAK
jgi:hypothetical protein